MASNWHTVSFTGLELKGLWIRATGGSTKEDEILDLAAEKALEKLYRAETGMPRDRPPQRQAAGKHPGIMWPKARTEHT